METLPENNIDIEKLKGLVREILVTIGENPEREGLARTPERVARFWKEFINYEPGSTETVFENGHMAKADQMVVVGPMRVWSLCERHLLPFYADIVVGYIPNRRILGLSKFARIAHYHAHRLQVQKTRRRYRR